MSPRIVFISSPGSELVGQLSRSQIYRDYERAFDKASSLPLTLRPPKSWSLVQRKKRNENPFCAILAQSSKGCSACLEMQDKIGDPESTKAISATCFAGLCDTAVPVRIGQKLVGFLQTGQVSLQPLSAERFQKVTQKLIELGANVDLRRLEDAYFHSQVLTPKQYAGLVGMLEVFATHLGAVGNQLVIKDSLEESPFTKQAKAYVTEHQDEEISLEEMARILHVSTFYFCKMFKKGTGLTFTDYLGRVRIERAKTLLLDPNRRVSEVAYEVGFGSLTHFNRLFSRIVGKSPSDYRETLSHS